MGQKSNGASSDMPFIIHHQYVKDLSFENPNPFGADQDGQPKITVNVSVGSNNIADNIFEVMLEIEIQAENDKNESIFILELMYGAVVAVNENIEESKIQELLMVEIPHYLFPYARNVVSDSTQSGGFPPFYLNPMDFMELYQQQIK